MIYLNGQWFLNHFLSFLDFVNIDHVHTIPPLNLRLYWNLVSIFLSAHLFSSSIPSVLGFFFVFFCALRCLPCSACLKLRVCSFFVNPVYSKLSDFIWGKPNLRTERIVAELSWRAPELLRTSCSQGRGTQKGDVYSFALILVELHSRDGPWSSTGLTLQGGPWLHVS